MKELLETACMALIAALRGRVPSIQSAEYVPAPPERAATYPAIAIMPEPFTLTIQGGQELIDRSGNPVIFNGQQAVLELGALRGSVRIFCAARLPPQRASLCDAITRAFFEDDEAPSRLLITIDDIEVAGQATGAPWPFAFLLDDIEWSDELVFSEKRWAWLRVDVDVPVLALISNAPLVTSMVVAMSNQYPSAGPPAALTDPSQVPALSPLIRVTVNADGTVGAYP